MSGQVDSKQLQLQISASAELLVRNLRRADGALSDYQRQTDTRLGSIDQRFGKLGASVSLLKENMGGFVAALGVGTAATAARSYLQLADTAKQLHAQLVLATGQFGSLGQAEADTQRIAAATRIGLEATTSLYGTFLRAAEPLGRTQADAAVASETFAKALKLGGASAETASQATLQFSQALASGVLRGDEFNSIAEASPRVLRLLADALGLPQGQLRALAAEGKLTANVLYDALTNTKVTAGLNKEFEQLPTTMGEAMTLVRDEAVKVAGAFDRGSQLSTAISTLVTDGVTGFGTLSDAAERSGLEIRATFIGLRDVFSPMLDGAHGVFDLIDKRANYTRDTIASLLGAYDRIRNVGVALDRGVQRLDNLNPLREKKPLREYYNTSGEFLASNRRTVALSRIDRSAQVLQDRGFIVPRRPDGTVDEAGIRRAPRRSPQRPASGPPAAATKGGRTRSAGGGRARGAAAEAYEFHTTDFPELYDAVQVAEAGKHFAQRQRDEFAAIFGEGDPLASLLDGAKQAQQTRLDDAFGGDSSELRPLAAYKKELQDAVGDMNFSLESVAVDGLSSIQDGLLGVIQGTQSVGAAFKQMASTSIDDHKRFIIERVTT